MRELPAAVAVGIRDVIVYGNGREIYDTVVEFETFGELLSRVERDGTPSYDAAAEILIRFGMLEAGIADARCPDRDGYDPVLSLLREAGTLAGRLFLLSCDADGMRLRTAASVRRPAEAGGRGPEVATGTASALRRLVNGVIAAGLPETLAIGTPEGYAYYALYPEAYASAAETFLAVERPPAVVTVGIRSIGTGLSSVVNAVLEASGVPFFSCTVRPRGNVFERAVAPDERLADLLRRRAGHRFLIVDEGPGLSGSSFASVAETLSSLGVPDSRISFLPSFDADPSRFVSPRARERWGRHGRYVLEFEDLYMSNGRLAEIFGGTSEPEDLSGGLWRNRLFAGRSIRPPVYPVFERRKYLLKPEGEGTVLLKFSGLSPFGSRQAVRARRLAENGFHPTVYGFSHGFIAMRFVRGVPCEVADGNDPALIDFAARYFAFLFREFPAESTETEGALAEMSEINIGEGLGREAALRFKNLVPKFAGFSPGRSVLTDGHNFPWEWLKSDGRFYKTDATDHSCDHLFVGRTDIAFDLASFQVEFDLDPRSSDLLVSRYVASSGDEGIRERLPFFTFVYLAFRLGIASFAAENGIPSEADGFRAAAATYRDRIGEALRKYA